MQRQAKKKAPSSMKGFGIAMLFAMVGYLIAVVASYFLVDLLSSNMHDRSLEAAMTSAFVFGPLGAVVAFVAGLVRGGRTDDRTKAGR